VHRASSGDGNAIYEVSYGRGGAEGLQASFVLDGEVVSLDVEGLYPRYVAGEGDSLQAIEESLTSLFALAWWDAFEDIRDLGRDSASPEGSAGWDEISAWLGSLDSSNEPRKSLIVEIAERLSTVGRHADHLRRILLRRREVTSIRHVRTLDQECIRWLIRKPGETLQEKAGVRQELMAVTPKETFNTVENRVFKDFLRLCSVAANRYEREVGITDSAGTRVRRTRAFKNSCARALTNPAFDDVAPPGVGIRPNYVLQSDPRYRKVWKYYTRLRRNNDAEEEVWSWQARMWADLCRVFVGAAFERLVPTKRGVDSTGQFRKLATSRLKVREHLETGRLLTAGWVPGPFLRVGQSSGEDSIVSIIDQQDIGRHPLASSLGKLGAQFFFVSEGVQVAGGEGEVIAVWALNGLAAKDGLSNKTVQARALATVDKAADAFQQATSHQFKGLILNSCREEDAGGAFASKSGKVSLQMVSPSQKGWSGAVDSIVEFLKVSLIRPVGGTA